GLATLSGATVLSVRPANGLYLTAEDVAKHARVESCGVSLLDGGDQDGYGCTTAPTSTTGTTGATGTGGDDWGVAVTMCPMRVVSVENTSHGNVVPLSELRALKEWATKHGVLVHVDGAGVWDAVASEKAAP